MEEGGVKWACVASVQPAVAFWLRCKVSHLWYLCTRKQGQAVGLKASKATLSIVSLTYLWLPDDAVSLPKASRSPFVNVF